jgi:hypothetical protein
VIEAELAGAASMFGASVHGVPGEKVCRVLKKKQETHGDPRHENSDPLPCVQLIQKGSHQEHRIHWMTLCESLFLLITISQRNNRLSVRL